MEEAEFKIEPFHKISALAFTCRIVLTQCRQSFVEFRFFLILIFLLAYIKTDNIHTYAQITQKKLQETMETQEKNTV